MPVNNLIQLRRGSSSTWTSTNTVLASGEPGYDITNNVLKIGDGSSTWSSLSSINLTSSNITNFNSSVNTLVSGVYAPISHSHGNITNSGAIGSTANLPLITTTAGAITVGSFGSTDNTFCQGNDSRLSDTRTPTDGTVTTAKIVDSNVTYAKIQNVSATDKLLGRSSSGAGVIEEIACTAAGRSLIAGVDAAAQRTTLGLGTLATQSGTFSGTSSGTNTGDQTFSITGDVTAAGSTSTLSATVTKINGVSLAGLTTGLLKNTTTTGAPSIAVAGTDYLVAVAAGTGITVSSAGGTTTINLNTFSTTIGNGSATSFTITHNLNVVNDSFVTVRDTSTNYYVYPDIKYVDANSILIEFVSAPTSNQYKVTIIGI